MDMPQTTQRTRRSRYAPLSYERMAILVAVAAGPIQKSLIAKAVLGDTVAEIVLKKSTTYFLIRELTNLGYLEVRGTHSLTDKGWRMLNTELNRIEQQRHILKQKLRV